MNWDALQGQPEVLQPHVPVGLPASVVVPVGSGVVIPSDQNRLSAVGFFVKSAQEVEVLSQCLVWWVGCIENITSVEQTIDFLLSNQLQQMFEKEIVFGKALQVAELLTKVPIRGVENTHERLSPEQGPTTESQDTAKKVKN